ncbi:MAG: hypothetical protein LBS98_05620 [Coriobacteriales bacterium]|jgi:hypothetical protein|nr:hypothetical protein [Coriobacteriales bacterium]
MMAALALSFDWTNPILITGAIGLFIILVTAVAFLHAERGGASFRLQSQFKKKYSVQARKSFKDMVIQKLDAFPAAAKQQELIPGYFDHAGSYGGVWGWVILTVGTHYTYVVKTSGDPLMLDKRNGLNAPVALDDLMVYIDLLADEASLESTLQDMLDKALAGEPFAITPSKYGSGAHNEHQSQQAAKKAVAPLTLDEP